MNNSGPRVEPCGTPNCNPFQEQHSVKITKTTAIFGECVYSGANYYYLLANVFIQAPTTTTFWRMCLFRRQLLLPFGECVYSGANYYYLLANVFIQAPTTTTFWRMCLFRRQLLLPFGECVYSGANYY